MTKADTRGHWIYTVIAIAIVAFLLFPLYWMINSSLEPATELFRVPPAWFPRHPTLAGYRSALSTQWPHLVTSLLVAGGTVVLTVVVAAPAAYALARFRLRGSAPVVFTMLLVQMIPGIVVANSLYGVFSKVHLLNTYPALILADSAASIPFAILIIRSFMLSIPGEIEEAARVDGSGRWSTFVRIILPLSRNALVTAGIFAFLVGWGDFLFALTLTNSNTVMPVTLSIYQYLGVNTAYWTQLMATAVIASVPAGLLLVVGQRYISLGLTGGVKG